MFTRATGFVIVPLWLVAMGWLVGHDLLPLWMAGEPPRMVPDLRLRGEGGNAQYVILDSHGEMGSIWSTHLVDEGGLRRDDTIWIERLPVDLAPLRVDVASVFTADGRLDELTVVLENPDAFVRLHGERFDTAFSFTLTGVGRMQSFKIPLSDRGMIGGALHPFGQLPGLHVGQKWRMQLVNPLAAIMPLGDRFIHVVAEVTGEERIRTRAGEINTLVVESPSVKAWVDARGDVVAQELTLPMIGKLRVERLPGFDRDAMSKVVRESLAPEARRHRG